MMRSMYSGVSGLKTHQTKMDVIGNNIANVNTVAYKSQSITFSELMYQTTQKSSGPNELTGTGGTNARQIGLGVQSAAINTAITTQGATQTTGNPYDLCITGNSFFIVSDGSQNYFTRAGAFNIDSVGNLVMTSNGYNVMGWGVDEETMTIKQDTVSALRIMSADNMTYPPEATSNAYVSGIIDKNDSDVGTEAGKALNLSFYDNLGYSYTAKFSIHSTTDDGTYYVELDDVIDSNGKSITEMYPGSTLSDLVSINTDETYIANVNVPYTKLDTVSFDGTNFTVTSTGNKITNLTSLGTADGDGNYTVTGPIDDTKIALLQQIYGSDVDFSEITAATIDATTGQLTVTQKSGAGVLLNYSTDDGSFMTIGGSQTGITIDFNATVEGDGESKGTSLEQFADISFDWTATNMYNNSGTSTIGATSGDKDGVGTGRKLGNMTGVTIQTNGMIYASYDNGMTRLMGQIAVAEFSNAAGLEKSGDNLYSASLNSGEFDGVGVDITGSGGYMTTGVLEMSNVDLSTEFTEMITTQRGFQANSRIITVSDTMLEELVNLKR
jgi:flagellar hook protein FlgE